MKCSKSKHSQSVFFKKDLLRDLTLIVLVRDRKKHIPQFTEYYQGWSCRKILFDSSKERSDISLSDLRGFEYVYFGPTTYYEKLKRICQDYVNTEYVVDCSDDDVLIYSGVLASLMYLRSHDDYVAAHGVIAGFRSSERSLFHKTPEKHNSALKENFHSDSVSERLKFFLSQCPEAVNHSILRTSMLRRFYEVVCDTPQWQEVSFFDRMLIAWAAVEGNRKVLDELYQLRDCSDVNNNCASTLTWEHPPFVVENLKESLFDPFFETFSDRFNSLEEAQNLLMKAYKKYFFHKNKIGSDWVAPEISAKHGHSELAYFTSLLYKNKSELLLFKNIYFEKTFFQKVFSFLGLSIFSK